MESFFKFVFNVFNSYTWFKILGKISTLPGKIAVIAWTIIVLMWVNAVFKSAWFFIVNLQMFLGTPIEPTKIRCIIIILEFCIFLQDFILINIVVILIVELDACSSIDKTRKELRDILVSSLFSYGKEELYFLLKLCRVAFIVFRREIYEANRINELQMTQA